MRLNFFVVEYINQADQAVLFLEQAGLSNSQAPNQTFVSNKEFHRIKPSYPGFDLTDENTLDIILI